MSKNDYIRIRCTRQQKESYKKLAELEGFTLTELILNLLKGEFGDETQKDNEK